MSRDGKAVLERLDEMYMTAWELYKDILDMEEVIEGVWIEEMLAKGEVNMLKWIWGSIGKVARDIRSVQYGLERMMWKIWLALGKEKIASVDRME